MGEKLDFKKEYRELYLPKDKPVLVEVPPILFLLVDGVGAPEGEIYQEAVGLLYSLSYTIKMSKMGEFCPAGYFEYVVPPLEGLWELSPINEPDRSKWRWTSMIRQPDFVTAEVFGWACEQVKRKKPELDVSRARLAVYDEGLCVQMLHKGPYSEEPITIAKLTEFIEQNGLFDACGTERWHHEIYLTDPLKTAPEKLKTVLRHPVGRKG